MFRQSGFFVCIEKNECKSKICPQRSVGVRACSFCSCTTLPGQFVHIFRHIHRWGYGLSWCNFPLCFHGQENVFSGGEILVVFKAAEARFGTENININYPCLLPASSCSSRTKNSSLREMPTMTHSDIRSGHSIWHINCDIWQKFWHPIWH